MLLTVITETDVVLFNELDTTGGKLFKVNLKPLGSDCKNAAIALSTIKLRVCCYLFSHENLFENKVLNL